MERITLAGKETAIRIGEVAKCLVGRGSRTVQGRFPRDQHHVARGAAPLCWPDVLNRSKQGNTVMNAIAAPKSRTMNWLEGVTLSALLQGLPTFTGAALLLKLFGSAQIVNGPGGAVIFVLTTSIFYAVMTLWLGPKFPRFFRNSYEPLFVDASLSFPEKLSRWREKPATSLLLLTNVVMLSLLAVAVMA